MAAFIPPTEESLLETPGYQFRLNQGRKALEASAAAKGTLRTGGTLKDILEYGQNFASNEYQGAHNRALDKWKSDWDQYVFANTPRGGGGRGQYDDIPPPPEAPGGDPYDPGYEDPGAGDGGYGGNPYTPEDPYGGYGGGGY